MKVGTARVRGAAIALAALGIVAAGAVAIPEASQTEASPVVETRAQSADPALVARTLRPLAFPTGVYVEERLSDQVSIPPGVTFRFANLPPGLTYDPGATAIRGTPTTPGVWDVTATAFAAGIPVETATSRVTVAGRPIAAPPGGAGPAPAAPPLNPGPQIDLRPIETLPLPPEAKRAIADSLTGFNQTLQDLWEQVPAGSLGR